MMKKLILLFCSVLLAGWFSSCAKDEGTDEAPVSDVTVKLDMTNAPDDAVSDFTVFVFNEDSLLVEKRDYTEVNADALQTDVWTLEEGIYKFLVCTNVAGRFALEAEAESVNMENLLISTLSENVFDVHSHIGFAEVEAKMGVPVEQYIQMNRLLVDFQVSVKGLEEGATVEATLLNMYTGLYLGTLKYAAVVKEIYVGKATDEALNGTVTFPRKVCMPTAGVAKFRLDIYEGEALKSSHELPVVAFKNGGIYDVEADFSKSVPYVTINGIGINEWVDGDDMNLGAGQM